MIKNSNTIPYQLYRILVLIADIIPISIGYKICDILGFILSFITPGTWEGLKHNHELIYPNMNINATSAWNVSITVRHIIKNYYDLLRMSQNDAQKINTLVCLEDSESIIDKALEGNRGLIIVTAHIGLPDLAAKKLALSNYNVSILMKHEQKGLFGIYFSIMRSAPNIEIITTNSPIKLYRALRNNRIVMMIIDLNTTGSGTEVDFFNRRVKMADGAVRLAHISGAPLFVACCSRNLDNQIIGHFVESSNSNTISNKYVEIRERHKQLISQIENIIKNNHTQWVLTERINLLP